MTCRLQISRKSIANQCNSLDLHAAVFYAFRHADLQLICSLQITATQSLVTFKKHYKTRANHCKSLQITPPENHRKNDAELQPALRVRPGQQAGGTESAIFRKLDVTLLYLPCAFSQVCHVVVCYCCYCCCGFVCCCRCWCFCLLLLMPAAAAASADYFLLSRLAN